MSGAPPSLSGHLELRTRSNELERAFGPFDAWVKGIELPLIRGRSDVRALIEATLGLAKSVGRSIFASAQVRSHRIPASCQSLPYRDIALVSWRLPVEEVSTKLFGATQTVRRTARSLPTLLADCFPHVSTVPMQHPLLTGNLHARYTLQALDQRTLRDFPYRIVHNFIVRQPGASTYAKQSSEAAPNAENAIGFPRDWVIGAALAHIIASTDRYYAMRLAEFLTWHSFLLAGRELNASEASGWVVLPSVTDTQHSET
jgi:hypothetical protein